jgi:hypothetical protein
MDTGLRGPSRTALMAAMGLHLLPSADWTALKITERPILISLQQRINRLARIRA